MVKVPFSGVDGLMDALDEPGRPQTIELEVAVAERLDDDRFREAVIAAANQHPMARARKMTARPFDNNFVWQIDAKADPAVADVATAQDDAALVALREALSSRHIDVTLGPPFRALLVHAPDGDRVLLSVNHAAFDGVAAVRLLQSMSRAYAGKDDPLPTVDPLTTRGVFDDPGEQRRTSDTPSLPKRSARLAPTRSATDAGFGILHLDLAVDDLRSGTDATINDVLLAGVHSAVDKWNRLHSARCEDVGVMVPASQRPPAWRNEVVANLVLTGHVYSTKDERSQPDRLLSAIAGQTKRMKADGVGGAEQLSRSSRTPVLFRQLLPKVIDVGAEHFADTTVLSNLGRIDDESWFGGEGRGIWFSPPPRRPVFLAIGAATVGEKLGLSLRWCESAMARADAVAFADLLRVSLGELVAVSHPDAPRARPASAGP